MPFDESAVPGWQEPMFCAAAEELTKDHLLRDVLLFVRGHDAKVASSDEVITKTAAAFVVQMTRVDSRKVERLLNDALKSRLVSFAEDKLSLSASVQKTLGQLDIITSSCGASMVRIKWGLPIYCWQCGGLM